MKRVILNQIATGSDRLDEFLGSHHFWSIVSGIDNDPLDLVQTAVASPSMTATAPPSPQRPESRNMGAPAAPSAAPMDAACMMSMLGTLTGGALTSLTTKTEKMVDNQADMMHAQHEMRAEALRTQNELRAEALKSRLETDRQIGSVASQVGAISSQLGSLGGRVGRVESEVARVERETKRAMLLMWEKVERNGRWAELQEPRPVFPPSPETLLPEGGSVPPVPPVAEASVAPSLVAAAPVEPVALDTIAPVAMPEPGEQQQENEEKLKDEKRTSKGVAFFHPQNDSSSARNFD